MFKLIKLIAVCCIALILAVSCGVFEIVTVSAAIASYDGRVIEDDLKDFDLSQYPKDEKGNVQLILFSEYCYSESATLSENYGLYFYVYNPREADISTRAGANVVNMAVSYNTAGDPTEYANLPVTILDQTDNHRFIKLRIANAAAALTRAKKYSAAHGGERRYDVAGIQLWTVGAANATDYEVSSTYRCTGYAKGCGSNAEAESTLSCTAEKLETVSLDIQQTYWRTPWINANGAGHYNQVSSVYFAVPKRFQQRHGLLYAVKCEWDERRTTPVIVTKNGDIYNDVLAHIGTDGNGGRFRIYDNFTSNGMGVGVHFSSWSYNRAENELACINKPNVGYVFKTTASNILDAKVSSAEMQKWVQDHNFADYLFTDDIDEGRQYGYQEHKFYADQPFDMLSFNSTASGFQKFCLDWGTFWKYDFGDEDVKVDPIKPVTDEDLRGTETTNAEKLYIHESDYGAFKTYFDSKKKENDVFLLRFAVTDYYSKEQSVFDTNDWIETADKKSTYMARETVFLNFDIIELTFKYEGKETVIPVVASPINHIAGIDPPVYVDEDPTTLIWGLATAGVLVVVIIVSQIVKRTGRKF